MVKHHHDSSQLTAALFGNYEHDDRTVDQRPAAVSNSVNRNGREHHEDFWDQVDSCRYQSAQSSEKTHELPQINQPMRGNQLQRMQELSPRALALMNAPQMQLQHMQQAVPYQTPQNSSLPMTSTPPMNSVMLSGGSSATSYSQYFPMQQMPMNVPGYGNGPVYVIMAPQGGVPQMLPAMMQNYPRTLPDGRETIIHTASSDGSGVSRASNTSEKKISCTPPSPQEPCGLRAKWGERGVGVGHLWSPEETPNTEQNKTSPQWVNDETFLPGASNSKQGERIHNRGASVVLDSQQMAEKQRKQKQAMENQRIIEMQLEEKKRLQQQNEERERKESEEMEKRIKEQQEKERKEFEHEQNKKKEKEEAEEKRQQKLRQAIADAAEKAKKEKDKARMARISKSNPEKNNREARLSTGNSDTPLKKSVRIEVDESMMSKRDAQTTLDHERNEEEAYEEEEKDENEDQDDEEANEPLADVVVLPDLVQTSQLSSLSQPEKIAILKALGVAPDYLHSSGIFDRSSFRSMVGPSLVPGPFIKEDGGEYIRNRILTPTKFRMARDCGTQCNSESDRPKKRESRRLRKSDSRRRSTPGSSPESRPPWGRHQSDRPYRKQSEKDPYSGRKIKKKPSSHRSASMSDHESRTEMSDAYQTNEPRRRRKTWDMSRQESLSSDFSRSPSPRRKKGPSINLPRGPPPIMSGLMPSLSRERCSESSLAHAVMTSNQWHSATKSQDVPEIITIPPPPASPDITDANSPIVPSIPFRSHSPPVPALMKMYSGTSTFNVPEYPPAVEQGQLTPRALEIAPTLGEETQENPNDIEETATELPLKTKRSNSLPSIEGDKDQEVEITLSYSRRVASAISRRSSLTGVPRMDPDQHSIISQSRPCSRTSMYSQSPSICSNPSKLPPISSSLSPKAQSDNNWREAVLTDSNSENRRIEIVTSTIPQGEKGIAPEITPVEISPRVAALHADKLMSAKPEHLIPASPTTSNKKKSSSDSGIFSHGESRPGSPESATDEPLALSIPSSGYGSGRKASNEGQCMSDPLVAPDKWNILKSISSLRQNLWRRQQGIPSAQETSEILF